MSRRCAQIIHMNPFVRQSIEGCMNMNNERMDDWAHISCTRSRVSFFCSGCASSCSPYHKNGTAANRKSVYAGGKTSHWTWVFPCVQPLAWFVLLEIWPMSIFLNTRIFCQGTNFLPYPFIFPRSLFQSEHTIYPSFGKNEIDLCVQHKRTQLCRVVRNEAVMSAHAQIYCR